MTETTPPTVSPEGTAAALNYMQQALEAKTLMLRAAAGQFRMYEASHRAKCTPDGEAKADANALYARRCDEAAAL